MSYVDGYLVPVPTANKEKYKAAALIASQVFKDHGALQVMEAWGDDVPPGKVTSFPMAVKCTEDETVVFAWVRWESREARDAGMKAAMADPRMQFDPANMAFDGQRMIFGGFAALVEM